MFPILGLFFGFLVGWVSSITIPVEYAHYLSIALLAGLDSIFGGVRSHLVGDFDMQVFFTGFFGNILLASAITVMGQWLGVELYLAVVIVFMFRLFKNLAIIRRITLKNYIKSKKNY
ncbi:small basic family protein [Proteinivorax tanatarense]|uniref:Small basic family protein n=1 Tax=Proteinivorax tanatarense TaxID=1260629 RepID=A0AAU7VPP1_9FIRM